MDGFVMSGKAFTVCEDLRILAERNKGITVAELLTQQRRERMCEALAKQFGTTPDDEFIQRLREGK